MTIKDFIKRHIWGIIALIFWLLSFVLHAYFKVLLIIAVITGIIWILTGLIASVRAEQEKEQ